jgi:arsenate reductase
LAVQALAEVGLDASGQHSKGLDDVPDGAFDTVVTLCADEVCPVLPGHVLRLHWPLPDPEGIDDFRNVVRALRPKIEALLSQT